MTGVTDGSAYARSVRPQVTTTDTYPTTTTITLNQQPFSSETEITADGTHQLFISARDEAGNITATHLTFIVDQTPPTITIKELEPNAVYPGTRYSYHVQATDTADDTLHYALTTAPPGMHIDSTTGRITWVPTEPGNYAVSVQVTDTQGATDTQSYTLTVAPAQLVPITTNEGMK